MLKHEICLCVMGSCILHVFMLTLLTRTVTVPNARVSAMEAFIIAPSPDSAPVTRPSLPPAIRAAAVRRALDTERAPARQKPAVPNSATARDIHPDSSGKSESSASVPVPAAPVPAAAGTVRNSAAEISATSRIPASGAGAHSTTTFRHGTEIIEEKTLGEAGAPRFIHKEPPKYPFLARRLGKEGKVVLRLTLDERGGQKDIEIIENAGFGFTEAAVQAIKKSLLSPAQKDGRPVVSRVLIPVKFVLREE